MKPQPNQQLAVRESPKAIAIMADRLRIDSGKLAQTLKATVFKNANDEEFMALCVVANEYGLNPLTRQIFAFKAKEGGGVTPVVSVDGWIKIVNDRPALDGIEFEDEDDEDGKPIAKTCIIYKKGCSRPTKIKERHKECYRPTVQWNTMPHRMLRHKALIQCARVAFGLGGIYDEDEARDIIRNVEGRVVEDAEPKRPLFKRKPEELPEADSKPEPNEVATPERALDPARESALRGRLESLVLEDQTEAELAATQEEEDKLWGAADQDGHAE